ncbi:hypothetical protein VTJ04DRAFT_1599 [Mycothermus thermophilus]|uniref:uncharacterized protein n=1 Tax=Humicola insolens TaxID=85995 RepID=UPI003744311B
MAPLATDPRQILAVLNPARRRALYTLLVDITSRMRSRLDFRDEPDTSPAAQPSLRIDPSRENSIVITEPLNTNQPEPSIVNLRFTALAHFDDWRKEVLAKLKDLLTTPDDFSILEDRRTRSQRLARRQPPNQTSINDEETRKAVSRLQAFYPPISTRLTTISEDDRREALSCVLLILLSTGHYSAHSRTLAVYLTSSLELPLAVLDAEETEIAVSLIQRSSEAQATMSADAEAERRRQENQASRILKVGLASMAGAALIGVTGGLAAPVVAGAIGGLMGSVGLGGVASFLGIFWMNGALVGTLFGALGAKMTGEVIDQYAREVEDFSFIPLKKDEFGARPSSASNRRLRITIGINGWLDSTDDVTKPWRALTDDSEVFALRYEMDCLLGLGKSLRELVSSYAWSAVKAELLKRTVLATLWSALWPAYLLSMASVVDNPFSLAKNRSEKAGEILADALINKVQGERPVTLIGYSLGARVVYACLRSLAQRRAFGLVDTVVFIGAPVPSNKRHWQTMRAVVSGNLINVYSENDYLLAFLYRATSVQLGVAGLQEIRGVEGVVNIDLSDPVQGHMRYAKVLPQILARCGIPVVKGADGPIQPGGDHDDDDVLRVEEREKGDANLIDLAGLDTSKFAAAPPAYAPSQPPPETRAVAKQPARSHQDDLLGLDFSMSNLSTSDTNPPSSKPQPSTASPPSSLPPSQSKPNSQHAPTSKSSQLPIFPDFTPTKPSTKPTNIKQPIPDASPSPPPPEVKQQQRQKQQQTAQNQQPQADDDDEWGAWADFDSTDDDDGAGIRLVDRPTNITQPSPKTSPAPSPDVKQQQQPQQQQQQPQQQTAPAQSQTDHDPWGDSDDDDGVGIRMVDCEEDADGLRVCHPKPIEEDLEEKKGKKEEVEARQRWRWWW